MEVAAKAKKTKPKLSSAAAAAAAPPKKFSAPAAKYGAPLPGREKSSALSVQRKKILAQAEKERLTRQRKREAEAKAMKKREDDRASARESEKKDRERRKRDLLLAEKKRREAASAARDDRRKEAAKQKSEYEAQVKARHKAFAERQQRAVASAGRKKTTKASSQIPVPSPKAASSSDPVLSEFLQRKNAAESYRQRYNRNRLFGAAPAADAEIAADSKDALGSTLTRRITYAESRSPAPKPPTKRNVRTESPMAPKPRTESDNRPAYVQPAADSQAKKVESPAGAGGAAAAAVRRRWGRSESPPVLQPVGTQVIDLAGSAGSAGTNVAAVAATNVAGSPASRKRWGRSESPPMLQPVGTQVIGLDGTSSVTDSPGEEPASDEKKQSPERKRWGQPASRKPFQFAPVGTGALEFTGDLGETGGIGGDSAEAQELSIDGGSGAASTDGNRDDPTPVPATADSDEVPPAEEMVQDQDDGDYEDMLCTMAELILNQDDDDDDDAAAEPSTPGKSAPAVTEKKEEDAVLGTPDASAAAAAELATDGAGAASGDDSGDDSYFEEESGSDTDHDDDDVMMGSDDDNEGDDLLSSLRASPVTPAHGSRSKRGSMTSEAGDDEEEDMDEMLDMMRTALKNATPDKRDQLLRAAPSMSVDTLLKSGPVEGLRLKGENIRSLRVEAELEKTVFHKLEETRARLEDELGAMAFVQAYRMIQQWREADDDEEDSAARKAEIEHLLESKNAVESFQQLLHLVIKDSMHYENDADVSFSPSFSICVCVCV